MPRIPGSPANRPRTADTEAPRVLENTLRSGAEEAPRERFVDGQETRSNATTVSDPSANRSSSSLSQAPGLLNGSVQLPDAGRKHPSVRVLQQGLATLAHRGGDAGLNPGGVDGVWGPKTQAAVKAFQKREGLEANGQVDRSTAVALERALSQGNVSPFDLRIGGLTGVTANSRQPDGGDMVTASQKLVKDYGNYYGVPDPWYNLDPNHALPANVQLGGMKGKWKCNLFGGNALYEAGFEPPYYGNKGRGEYPNANQFFKWSDKYAEKYGNKVHFKMVGEVEIKGLSEDEKKARIGEVLSQAKPGDMILVDHLGDDVADGGHTRVIIENNWAEDGTLTAAQASRSDAQVKSHGLYAFTGEETLWVLRPNRPRTD